MVRQASKPMAPRKASEPRRLRDSMSSSSWLCRWRWGFIFKLGTGRVGFKPGSQCFPSMMWRFPSISANLHPTPTSINQKGTDFHTLYHLSLCNLPWPLLRLPRESDSLWRPNVLLAPHDPRQANRQSQQRPQEPYQRQQTKQSEDVENSS